MAKLNTSLRLKSDVYGGRKGHTYNTTHVAASAFDTTFKVNNSDTFRELIEFKPDGTKTYNKFNYLLIANDGNQSAEIQIVLREFGTDDDIVDANPESATVAMVLHPGKYFMLPSSKLIVYSTDPDDNDVWATGDTSAGNKDGTSLYDTTYATTGPKFISPPGYFIASGADGDVNLVASANTFDVDIAEDFFKTVQMGNGTDGFSSAKLCLFGECHADELADVLTISGLGDGTYANTVATLSAVGNNITDADATYLGAYQPVMQVNGALTASTTLVTYDNFGSTPSTDGAMFKKYDIIRIGNELMQVEAMPLSTTLTVKRGILGTTAVSHNNDAGIGLHYMNKVINYLDSTDSASQIATAGCALMKGDSNIYTNSSGIFYASSFFGLGRSDSYPNGLVPGSIAIKFYGTSTFPLGVYGLNASSKSGLAVSTEYRFKLTVDGTAYNDIDFTTDAVNTSLGSYVTGTGVLSKIQTALNADNCPVTIRLIGNDIIFETKTRFNGLSNIIVADATSGSGTQLFGTGIFPALTALRAVNAPSLPADEDVNAIMFDDGEGKLYRHGGGTGFINYETGAFLLQNCPQNAHMKVACNFNSALSGNVRSDRGNFIPVVKARSLNVFRDAYVRLIAYDDIIDDDNVELLMTGVESDVDGFLQSVVPGMFAGGGSGYTSGGEGGA